MINIHSFRIDKYPENLKYPDQESFTTYAFRNARAIVFTLVLAIQFLKMVEWGVIVGSYPTITPHF
jgi:hypothetical protein